MGQTFDGGVIVVHELALDELDCETAFAHTTIANDDELVLA